jgi:hypothetical protein
MAEPSQEAPPVVIRLADAARGYERIVAEYLALSEDPSRLSKAFGLLAPMEHALETWIRAARAAAEEPAVRIPPGAVRRWAAAFRAWLGNQASLRDALVECAAGRPITELTLIECLDTIGPLVSQGEKLSSELNALLDSEPRLAAAFSELRF